MNFKINSLTSYKFLLYSKKKFLSSLKISKNIIDKNHIYDFSNNILFEFRQTIWDIDIN